MGWFIFGKAFFKKETLERKFLFFELFINASDIFD